jgi:hypothetical protein
MAEEVETPPADADDAGEETGSTVEIEDAIVLVMIEAATERAAGATKITIDGLQGDEITLTAEIPDAEPFTISLPAEEVARRAAEYAPDAAADDDEEEPAEGEE